MHTIDTIEDLIQLLDEKPEWAEALRVRLLPSELIELPEKFTQFVAEMKSFVAEMKSFVAEMNKFVKATNKRLASLEQRFDHQVEATDKRFNRIEAILGQIKGILARNVGIENAAIIAREMGLRRTKTLSAEDIWDLIDSADTSGIPTNELKSFRRADLIMEATDKAGEICYIAAEISFTVNGRDTARAIRNAEFLTRFTDKRAYAAVSGVHRDNRIRDSIESGDVFWHEMDRVVLKPE